MNPERQASAVEPVLQSHDAWMADHAAELRRERNEALSAFSAVLAATGLVLWLVVDWRICAGGGLLLLARILANARS